MALKMSMSPKPQRVHNRCITLPINQIDDFLALFDDNINHLDDSISLFDDSSVKNDDFNAQIV